MTAEDKKWLSLMDISRKKFVDGVWIPLWGYVEKKFTARDGDIGRHDECRIFNTLLVPKENKKIAMKNGVPELHPMTDRYAVIGTDPYFPANAERDGYDTALGTYLVVKRQYGDGMGAAVSIDQNLIFDLRLKQEGDKWLRPCEDYREVMRQSRNKEGEVCLVEIKAEYLKDWLAVRKQGLLLVGHVERLYLSQKGNEAFAKAATSRPHGGHLEQYSYGCDEKGAGVLGDWKVSTVGYEDVFPNDDVPVFDPCSDEREMKSSESEIKANKVVKCMDVAKFYRTEWLNPPKTQRRMPIDGEGNLKFICEADGREKSAKVLEDSNRYLWFRNSVLKEVASHRGGWIRWLTRETGLAKFHDEPGIHFGINSLGHVNVFAKDIAKLEWWKQEIWRAYNISPDGGVSEELLSSQQKCDPAKTSAPESLLLRARQEVIFAFSCANPGKLLLKNFEGINQVGDSIQRFNVQKQEDVYWLAKQLTRLFIESLNQEDLREIVKPKRDEKLGSLKLLERALGLHVGVKTAYRLMSPLHAIYTLRMADSHIPGTDIADAMREIDISPQGQLIRQGGRLIYVAARAFHEIARAFLGASQEKDKLCAH